MTLRTVGKILLLIGANVLLLELILQGISGIQYYRQRVRLDAVVASRHPKGETRILCIGDSFTFGMGASSNTTSYPSRLEALLNAQQRRHRWKVVNFGKPGLNSSEALQSLPTWLKMTSPAHVCLLIGTNDEWNKTFSAPPADTTPLAGTQPLRWVWKYRTGLLVRLLIRRFRQSAAPAMVEEKRSSVAETSVSAPTLTIDQLWKAGDDCLFRRNDYQCAEAAFRRVIALDAQNLYARVRLAQALQRQRQIEEALLMAEALKARAGELSTSAQSDLAILYADLGIRATARAIAEHAWDTNPGELSAALCLTRLAIDEARYDEALQYLRRVELLNPLEAGLYRERCFVQIKQLQLGLIGDSNPAYEDVVRYYGLSKDAQVLRDYLPLLFLVNNRPINHETFMSLAQSANADPADLETLGRLFDETLRKYQEEVEPQLVRNLQTIASTCRQAGVPLLLLTYPGRVKVNPLIRQIAAAQKLPLLDVEQHLRVLMEARGLPDKYFLFKDGHANDRGYQEMARLVANHLLKVDKVKRGSR